MTGSDLTAEDGTPLQPDAAPADPQDCSTEAETTTGTADENPSGEAMTTADLDGPSDANADAALDTATAGTTVDPELVVTGRTDADSDRDTDTAPDSPTSASPSARPTAFASNPARRAALEAERDFLLASLADLEAEHQASEIDDHQYQALTDRYTARAAQVLRALDLDPEPAAHPKSARPKKFWRRRAVVLSPLVGVLLIGVALLPSALSRRQPGQTISGNAQSAEETRASIERAVTETPDDPAAHRAYARLLLDDGDLLGALQHYDEAARLDPSDAESRAYGGWIVSLAGLPDRAIERLDAAIAADPAYPDAHFFRGMVLRDRGDTAAAVTELRRYLELAPDTPLRTQVEQLIADLEQQGPTGTTQP